MRPIIFAFLTAAMLASDANACPPKAAVVVQPQAQFVQAQVLAVQPVQCAAVVAAPVSTFAARSAARQSSRRASRCARRCGAVATPATPVVVAAQVGAVAPQQQNFELVPQTSGVTVQTGALAQVNAGAQYRLVPSGEPTPADPAPEGAVAADRVVTAVPPPAPPPAAPSSVSFELVEIAPPTVTYSLRAVAVPTYSLAPPTVFAAATPVVYAASPAVIYARPHLLGHRRHATVTKTRTVERGVN